MYIVKKFETVLFCNVMDNTIPVYIIFHFPITYRNASECACLHQPVNIVAFFTTYNKNTYPKETTNANVQSCPYNEKRKLFIRYTLVTVNTQELF